MRARRRSANISELEGFIAEAKSKATLARKHDLMDDDVSAEHFDDEARVLLSLRERIRAMRGAARGGSSGS